MNAEPIRYYNYDEFREITRGKRAELISGQIVFMNSPSTRHQDIERNLMLAIGGYLRGKRCKIYANLELRPFGSEDYDDVFVPDLMIVCDPEKIRPSGIVGAPDTVIEILSPTSRGHDMLLKRNKYLRAGIPEYWIVDPDLGTVEVNLLQGGKYSPKTYAETIKVQSLADCEFNLSEIFNETP